MRDRPFLLPVQNPKHPVPTELTEEMFTAYCKVVEMLLAVRLSLVQKATARRILAGYFAAGNKKGIRSTQEAVETYGDLMRKEAVERLFMIRRELPNSLKELREQAVGQETEAKFLLSVYHAAYPTVAPGDPPLTRDVADAWIAMDRLIRAKIWEQKVPPLNPNTRARYEKKIAARWKTFSKEKRYKYIGLPAELIQLKHGWSVPLSRNDRLGWQYKILEEPDKRDVLLENVENPFKPP